MNKRVIHAGNLFGIILLVCVAAELVASHWIKSDVFRIALLRDNRTASLVSTSIGVVLLIAGCVMGGISHEAFKRAVTESGNVEFIIKDGFFKMVRHPFYLSLILIYFSLVLFFRSYILLAGWAVVTFYLFHEARREERLLVEKFGEEYLYYQRKTGMFLPKFASRK